ncbi:MAG: hypothetical protein ACHP7D_05505 [Lysobacterales bacterium]
MLDLPARRLSDFGGQGENPAVRGQIFDDAPAHGGSLGQEAAESVSIKAGAA